jgi:hypothetical protein
MFLGGIPKTSAQQIAALLEPQDHSRVFVCCSGSFRIERTIFQRWPDAKIYSNDVTFFSCMLGKWLAGQDVAYRFTGELEPLDVLVRDASPRRRMAAVSVALDVSDFASGKRNRYKIAHMDHLLARLPELLDRTEAKLGKAFGDLVLAGFHAGDWREHLETALAEKATVVTFPPFFKGGYEALYKWLDANSEWERPTYPMYDPKSLQGIVDRIVESDSGYVIGSGPPGLERPEPKAVFTPPTGTAHILYAREGQPKLIRNKASYRPFKFQPLDVDKLTADTKVTLTKVDGARAMYVRGMFLKKTIRPAPGRWNYLVYLDGMLAGVLVFDVSKFGPREDCLYLLSDVSVSRAGKVSKLIAALALNRALAADMAAKALKPFGYVVTTAFSDHPVSMKYRGVWDLLSRKDAEPPMTGFQLQYGQEVRAETPQETYAWWWRTHVDQAARQGGDANTNGRGRGGGRGRR